MNESNKSKGEPQATETEIAFWRSIANGNDTTELELYLEQFPEGAYSKLAKHKIEKLRGSVVLETTHAGWQAYGLHEGGSAKEAAEKVARNSMESQEVKFGGKTAQLEAVLAKQEKELRRHEEALKQKQTEAAALAEEIRKKKGGTSFSIAVVLLVGALGLGGFYVLGPASAPDQAELAKMLDAVKKANQELSAARDKEQELQKRVALAKAAEEEAKASGDVGRQQKMAAESRKQEAELAKQAEEVKKREAEEKRLAEIQSKKKAELENIAKQSDVDRKAASERASAERVLAEKAAAERAAAERAAAEKVAMEKAVAEKISMEKAAADRVTAERIAAQKAAEKNASSNAGWPSVGDRWIYDVRDADHPERRFDAIVEVKTVSSGLISDLLRSGNLPAIEQKHKTGENLLYWDGRSVFVLSPYMLAFEKLQVGKEITKIENVLGPCRSQANCYFSAKVVSRETVTVKAGTYDSWKVSGTLNSNIGFQELVYWYSYKVNRYVKSQSRRLKGSGQIWGYNPNIDMELVSYDQAARP